MMEDIYTTRDEYAFNFFGGAEGETWEVDDRGYAVSIPGTGSAKDGAEGTRLGARMLIGHAAPPVDVYIAPNRHAPRLEPGAHPSVSGLRSALCGPHEKARASGCQPRCRAGVAC